MNKTYNYQLPQLPERTVKPREKGMTMVMDKGLSLRQAEDFLSMTDQYVDIIKFRFWDFYRITKFERKNCSLQRSWNPGLFGGTLFEAFLVRDRLDDYLKYSR